MTTTALHPPEEILLGFARALRAAGVPVTADREQTYLRAVATVGLQDQAATYWAGRATLCGSPSDLARYDQVYSAWFSGLRSGLKAPRTQTVMLSSDLPHEDSQGAGQMRPVISGKLFVACRRAAASSQRPRCTRSFQSGMRLPRGQPAWQNGTPQSMQRVACVRTIASSWRT